MGASSKTPDVPDYTGAANTQAAQNQSIAQLLTSQNRPTQIDPYGQTTWSRAPGIQSQLDNLTAQLNAYNADAASHGWERWQPTVVQGHRQGIQSQIDALNNQPGSFIQTTTYTPEQQALLNQKQGIQSTQNDMISQLLAKYQGNMPQQAQTPALQQYNLQATPNFNPVGLQQASQNNISDLMYKQLTQNMDQQFARDEAGQRQNLANQGFQTGSEGFNNAMRDFFNQKNQSYSNANQQAQLAGYSQMNTENAQNLQNYLGQNNFGLQDYLGTRQANLNDYTGQNQVGLNSYIGQHNANLADYNTQMGYLAQLLGGTQGPASVQAQYPQFMSATPYQAPDLLGALSGQYQAQLNSTNAQNAARGQNMNSLGNLASIGAMAFL